MKRADLDTPPDLPFSRPYLADSVRDGGDYIKISANEGERAALARELGLVAIASLSAEFSVTLTCLVAISFHGTCPVVGYGCGFPYITVFCVSPSVFQQVSSHL